MPLPRDLSPMLATTGALPPDGGWAYEVKWDGVRVLAAVEDGAVTLSSRAGNDVTGAYPELRALAATVPGPLLLDGEVVALDAAGRPDFGLLQSRMHVRGPAPELVRAVPVTLVLFDLLHDGAPHLSEPYDERRSRLEQLDLTGPTWQLSPAWTSDGATVLEVTRARGMEGVVAKRLDSPYEPGRRSEQWVKVKHVQRQSAVVGGWKPGEGRRAGTVGSLLLGVQTPVGLCYAGHVGTGFTDATLDLLMARLLPLRRGSSPYADEVPRTYARSAVWTEPELVVDVDFQGWTRDGRLRHPSYKGLRDDLDPAGVTREESRTTAGRMGRPGASSPRS